MQTPEVEGDDEVEMEDGSDGPEEDTGSGGDTYIDGEDSTEGNLSFEALNYYSLC
jgi:hypothetical protein